MKNTLDIHTDGINIYATFKIQANFIGKFILIVFICLILALLGIGSKYSGEDQNSDLIPFLIVILSLLIAFPLRYLVWNISGSEYLIINTKSISYNYDYGIFRTNLKTKTFSRLATEIVTEQVNNHIKKGHLRLYEYSETNNLPQVIHETTILIENEKIEDLITQIWDLFENEEIKRLSFSMN